MDIDRIIDNIARDAKKGAAGVADPDLFTGSGPDIKNMSLADLCQLQIKDDSIKIEIYKRFKAEAEAYIENYVEADPRCRDINKNKGMFKCSHETYQACIKEFGIDYFMTNKYLHDIRRERVEGGSRMREDLLEIGMEVFEALCDQYRKVFQIVDCCAFLGVNKDYMYQLNEMHALFLKKLHTAAENSLRIGALTGRGNVTGHAIILNHDYDYTRTTQVIHTQSAAVVAADRLPVLEAQPQYIDVTPAADVLENM